MDTTHAAKLMESFAVRTGLSSKEPPRRYLWTDAFAVCNLLELGRLTGDRRHKRLALQLVDQVHQVLGRHRDDDVRDGWLSGLGDEEASAHPTVGGLRIGKPLPERGVDEAIDQRLEWERDGQYFHYLTKWMHALDLMAHVTEEPRYNLWARELAKVAVDAFSYTRPGSARPRMYWKMSIDLSRPQITSMGQHDPLDGYVTCKQLAAGGARWAKVSREVDLDDELRLLEAMCEGRDWTSSDPLGLGGILLDAERLHHLTGVIESTDYALLSGVLDAAIRGLERYEMTRPLSQPADQRLAFRELGLAIGLHGLELMAESDGERAYERFEPYWALRDEIISFWKEPEPRDTKTWHDHQDINDVMLATALLPESYMLSNVLQTR